LYTESIRYDPDANETLNSLWSKEIVNSLFAIHFLIICALQCAHFLTCATKANIKRGGLFPPPIKLITSHGSFRISHSHNREK